MQHDGKPAEPQGSPTSGVRRGLNAGKRLDDAVERAAYSRWPWLATPKTVQERVARLKRLALVFAAVAVLLWLAIGFGGPRDWLLSPAVTFTGGTVVAVAVAWQLSARQRQ